VTTVARTIADVALVGLSAEFVEQAVREAIAAGLVLPEDLLIAAERRGPRVGQMIRRSLERAGTGPTESP
jgi:hypothetical protein